MGGWIAVGVREFKGLESGDFDGWKPVFDPALIFTHFASNRPRQIVMYS